MKKMCVSIFLSFAMVASSIAMNEKSTFLQEFDRFFEEYKDCNINEAEVALHKFIETIKFFQEKDIDSVNLDSYLGQAYLRLYLIECEKGNAEIANIFLSKAMDIHFSGKSFHEDEKKQEVKKIIELQRQLDINNSVKWIKGTELQKCYIRLEDRRNREGK